MGRLWKRSVAAVAAVSSLGLVVGAAPAAASATGASATGASASRVGSVFVVDTTADSVDAVVGDGVCADVSGACSLRAAVLEANADPDVSEVRVPAGKFVLSLSGVGEDGALSGDLDVSAPLVVVGDPDGWSTVNGAGEDRIFDARADLEIRRLRLTNGYAAGADLRDRGGAVRMTPGTGASLTVTRSEFAGNSAGSHGGAIGAFDNVVRVSESRFARNTSGTRGGAIDHQPQSFTIGDEPTVAGRLDLTDTVFVGNAARDGGAINMNTETSDGVVRLTADRVSFVANTARGEGGALAAEETAFTAFDTSFERNRAVAGGAIFAGFCCNSPVSTPTPDIEGTTVVLVGATFTANEATGPGGGMWLGQYTSLRLVASTARRNTAVTLGGFVYGRGTRLDVSGSRLVENHAEQGGAIASYQGVLSISGSRLRANRAERGGAVALWMADTLTWVPVTHELDRAFLLENEATEGGAMWADGLATVSVVDSYVQDNVAAVGAGLEFGELTELEVHSTLFSRNTSTSSAAAEGGAAIRSAGSVALVDTNAVDNVAGGRGGAVLATGPLTVSGGRFTGNRSATDGGAIAVDTVELSIVGAEFRSNLAENEHGPGRGGALALFGRSLVEVNNALFVANAAAKHGGAVFNAAADTVVEESKLRDNSAGGIGPNAFNSPNAGSLVVNGAVVAQGTGI